MSEQRGRESEKAPPKAHRRIWAAGAIVIAAITISCALNLLPLRSVVRENRQVRADDLGLQQVMSLSTSLANWQVYFEPRVGKFSATASTIDPVDLAAGAQLGQAVATNGKIAVAALRSVGLTGNARDLEAANATFLKSIANLAPLAAGRPAAIIIAAVGAERTAFLTAWSVTATAAGQLRAAGVLDLVESSAHLESGRTITIATDVFAVALTLAAAIGFGERARRREALEHTVAKRRTFETMMQHALEMSKAEPDVYAILREALQESVPGLQVEMLVADSSRAHFHQTLTTGSTTAAEPRSGCGVASPLDCPATARGDTLVFPTSRALDACPYLKGRDSGECSAVCVAISVAGKTVGVLHATGADGVEASEGDIRYLEITSRRASERIAMLRAFEKSEAQARSDPLTGLWNRRSLEDRVHDLHREGIPYSLAYGDLDHFKQLNDTHGHEAGDQALRLFARVLRDSMRPNDIAARYGGEEFVIVLPDCSTDTAISVLERLRERLALTVNSGRAPAFTISFGVASSADAATFDEVVAVADQALLSAKTAGRNRTVLATDPNHQRTADTADDTALVIP